MMKLMVVDDEKAVLDSIKLIIEREGIEGVELKTVTSGRHAIEVARDFCPQIIFMDINLPGINGFEAMASISAFLPSVHFVMLTAYEVFEYAQKSINFSVYKYVVKPFSPMKIVKILRELIDLVDREKLEYEETIRIREEHAILKTAMTDALLQRLVSGGCLSQAEVNKYMPEKGGRICILQVKKNYARKRVEYVLPEFAAAHKGVLCGNFRDSEAVVFIPADVDASMLCERLVQQLNDKSFSVSYGSLYEDFGELWISYRQAVTAMRKLTGMLRSFDDVTGKDTEHWPLREYVDQLLQTSDNEEQMDMLLRSILSKEDILKSIQEATVLWMMAAEECLNEREYRDIVYKECYRLRDAADTREVREILKAMIRSLKRNVFAKNTKTINPHILEALTYIEKNFAQDITLKSLSDKLCLSPGSLSRLFRQQLNQSFMEVLTEKRIKCACKLLSKGHYVTKEICYMVGYNDPSYFCRAFKKATGCTPTEYKNQTGCSATEYYQAVMSK